MSSKSQKSGYNISAFYLAFYNGLQCIGWTYILLFMWYYLGSKKTSIGLWQQISFSVNLFQTLALLEVLHCLLRIVQSSAYMTFVQVWSRLFAVWAIVNGVPEIQNVSSIPLMLTAWSVTEVIRYAYYAVTLFDMCPNILLWCRYSFFLVLYPCGVSGEILTMVAALPHIKEKQIYSILLPNKANFSFSFYYAVLISILLYIPFFPQLFLHMIHRRRKFLGSQGDSSTADVAMKKD